MYHRFGESEWPSSNVRIDQFEEHLVELKTGGYTVLPVPEILERMRSGVALPEKTVGITIDDAYKSVFTNAWPRLKKAGYPATLFVATDSIDQGSPAYMTWDEIREVKDGGWTIGSQTASHQHLPEITLERVKLELDRAAQRLDDETGERPTLLAYPYGEYGLDIQRIVAERGYAAAFGQQSGGIHAGNDRFGLPRFALNEAYGGIDRFRLTANALPLPVQDQVPADLNDLLASQAAEAKLDAPIDWDAVRGRYPNSVADVDYLDATDYLGAVDPDATSAWYEGWILEGSLD